MSYEGTYWLCSHSRKECDGNCTNGSETTDIEHEHEFYSVCCGAETEMMEHLICPQCRDFTGFECECGTVYQP